MTKKLTPWFTAPEVNPVRPGVYISTVDKKETFYRRWDGSWWYCGDYKNTSDVAESSVTWPTPYTLYWRGLAKEPK